MQWKSTWLGTKKGIASAWIQWTKEHSRLREGEFENRRVYTTLQKCRDLFIQQQHTKHSSTMKKVIPLQDLSYCSRKKPKKTPNSKLDILKSNQAVHPDMFQSRRKIFTNWHIKCKYKVVNNRIKKKPNPCQRVLTIREVTQRETQKTDKRTETWVTHTHTTIITTDD